MSVVILAAWLTLVPLVIGGGLPACSGKGKKNIPFCWVAGQIILWALFEVVCVPCVLLSRRFTETVALYAALTFVLLIVSVWLGTRKLRKAKWSFHVIRGWDEGVGAWQRCLWAAFALLFLFQLVQAVRLAYADGDDAFYVAVATVAEKSDRMYQILPYTGSTTGLDARHGLAPFPIWIAFLARISGMRTVSVAQVAVPLTLIPMTYAVFYLIGRKLFPGRGERLPLFLVMTELLVLFGDYSFYTVENFMIARSRQGKSAMGSIVFPMMLYVSLSILEKVQERQKVGLAWWGLLASTVLAACLCSTLGTMLSCLFVGVVGLCAAFCYRRWKLLLPLAACCLPAGCLALLYLMLG